MKISPQRAVWTSSPLSVQCSSSAFGLRDLGQEGLSWVLVPPHQAEKGVKKKGGSQPHVGRGEKHRWGGEGGSALDGPFSWASAASSLEKHAGGLLVPAAPRMNWLFLYLPFVFNCLKIVVAVMCLCSWDSLAGDEEITGISMFTTGWCLSSKYFATHCSQQLTCGGTSSASSFLQPWTYFVFFPDAIWPCSVSPHASLLHLTHIEAKALAVLISILRFSEVQAECVKSRLAESPFGCRVEKSIVCQSLRRAL